MTGPEDKAAMREARRIKAGFNPALFEEMAELQSRNFWYQARNKLIGDLVAQYFPDYRSFLEVGCGPGFILSGLSERFPGRRLAGLELFEEGLALARKRVPGAWFYRLDVMDMDFDCEYDLLGSFDSLGARGRRPGGT